MRRAAWIALAVVGVIAFVLLALSTLELEFQ